MEMGGWLIKKTITNLTCHNRIKKVKLLVIVLFLVNFLNSFSEPKEALFWESLDNNRNEVQCLLCPRRCVIPENQRGFCGARKNIKGKLYTLAYNNPVAVAIDPIEKKPFFHVLPGSRALSIAVGGCNMHCLFCQNWHISQRRPDQPDTYYLTPKQIIEIAKKEKVPAIVFTYTEPTIFYEYMLEIARLAKDNGFIVGMHSCGYINPQPLKELLPYLDMVNIDLKSFDQEFYQELAFGAQLEPVLTTLKIIHQAGVHLEITNLLIPGKNDSPEQVRKMAKWIVNNLGPDTPLHISRFYPHYRLKNYPPTAISSLKQAYKVACNSGLHYVYIGNVVGIEEESTFCPQCHKLLIKRVGYGIEENRLNNGHCPFCGYVIKGIWQKK